MAIKEIIASINAANLCPIGCTADEVKKVEAFYKVKLPAAYSEFLLATGKGAGQFMRGTHVFYEDLFKLKEWRNNLPDEVGFPLPDNAFVFWIHQGYMLCYFVADEKTAADPPVFLLSEDPDGYQLYEYATFTSFLEKELEASDIKVIR